MTNATTPRHIWLDSVIAAACARGVSGDWLRQPKQRERLNRAYNIGEPTALALETVLAFWKGWQRAAIEDQDGLSHIRAAVRP